jgi:adenylate cyclase class 2
MPKTKIEIELKFKIDDYNDICKKLQKSGADFLGKSFEKTIRFDSQDKRLEKNGLFLRVRTGFKNIVTLKKKILNRDFKEREEIEFEISDPEKMELVFSNLGFNKKKIMEKYREKWTLNNTEVVVDKLPMGDFAEIEGDEASIEKTANILGLDLKKKITATYWDLWEDFCKDNGVKEENIIFEYKK